MDIDRPATKMPRDQVQDLVKKEEDQDLVKEEEEEDDHEKDEYFLLLRKIEGKQPNEIGNQGSSSGLSRSMSKKNYKLEGVIGGLSKKNHKLEGVIDGLGNEFIEMDRMAFQSRDLPKEVIEGSQAQDLVKLTLELNPDPCEKEVTIDADDLKEELTKEFEGNVEAHNP